MKNGIARVNRKCWKQCYCYFKGGIIIINGNWDDFTFVEMKIGVVIINGSFRKFFGAKKIVKKIFEKKNFNPSYISKIIK